MEEEIIDDISQKETTTIAVMSTDTIDQYHKNQLVEKGYAAAKKDKNIDEAYSNLAKKDLLNQVDEGSKDIDNNSEIGDVKRDTNKNEAKSENDASYCNRYRATLEKYHKNPDGLAKPQAKFWVAIDWIINIIVLLIGGWILILLKKLFDLTSKLGKGLWISIGVLIGAIIIFYIMKMAIQLNSVISSIPIG